MHLYFDWEGNPIDGEQWSRLLTDERHIGDDHIGDAHISTIWIGLDHSVFGPPLIFETMIFGGERDGYVWRYSTEREAREGHLAVCAEERLRANI